MRRNNSIALTAFLLAVSGCAGEINGFDIWNGNPTPATMAAAQQSLSTNLKRLDDTLAKVPKRSLKGNDKASAKEVLHKLKDLRSVIDMGVSYNDYPKYVRDARFTLNRFSSNSAGQRDLIKAFDLCLQPFVDAQQHFSEYVLSRRGSIGENMNRWKLHNSWKTGKELVQLLATRFDPL